MPPKPPPGPRICAAANREELTLSRSEFLLGIAILAIGLVLRIVYVFVCRFNSDEPQHLHVAWAWAHGMMQYRDVFDNHAPLFHLIMAPLVRLFGDRYDLLIWMRLAMAPFYVIMLWCTYRIAKVLLSPRLGFWAFILTAFLLPFLEKSVEFRTDTLWAMLFVAAVAMIIGSRLTGVRGLLIGILLGAAIAVSLKTCVLLACLLGAGISSWLLCAKAYPQQVSSGRNWIAFSLLLLGLAIIPAAVIAWFYAHGALDALYYGTIQHNNLEQLGKYNSRVLKRLFFVPAIALLVLAARKCIVNRDVFAEMTPAYTFLFLLTGFYVAAVETLWPLGSDQDFLPLWPIVMILLMPVLDWVSRRFARPRRKGRWWALAPWTIFVAVGFFELLVILLKIGSYSYDHRVATELDCWKAVLELTGPEETVMDPKGELIFRKRASYWVLETITRARLRRNLIPNTINDCLVANRTCVVYPDIQRYPESTQEFIRANYLSVGPLLVAGKKLTQKEPTTPGKTVFDVRIPAQYAILTPDGPAKGLLDEKPCTDGVFLEAGRHEYCPAPGDSEPVLLWARAAEHGYTPFRLGVNESEK